MLIHYRLRHDSPLPLCGRNGGNGDTTDITRSTCSLCRDMAGRYNAVVGHLETETIDKLFLELSQVAKARSWRELAYERELERLRDRVNAYEAVLSSLDDWDWAGLARDARRGDLDLESVADALETIARVDAARKAQS